MSTQPEFLQPPYPVPPTQSGLSRRLLLLILSGLGGMLICTLACMVVLVVTLLRPTQTVPVTIIVSGTGYQVNTGSQTVGDVLREFALTLNEGDTVSPMPDTVVSEQMVIQVERARAVTVTVDGAAQSIQTVFTNPSDILKRAGVTVGEKDRIVVDGTETEALDLLVWPVPVTTIQIQRAIAVRIEADGRTIVVETTARTVGEALFEAGVTLYLADTVTPGLNDAIVPDQVVRVVRSNPISIVVDGVTLESRTQGSTVMDALIGAGVVLTGLDYAIPDEMSPLVAGMSVRVIRVSEKVEVEQAVIPFETVYQPDNALELDQKVVIQEGQNGVQQTNIRIRYENGVEVSRSAEESGVARAPINRVVAYGTAIVLRVLDTPEGPKEYWRVLRMYTTSYHPAALGGDNITATGKVLTKGIVGIDPKIIPYGTQVYVPGYGVGVAADTGGPRKFKLWIDLGYDDENWVSWSKYTDVYLLTPVPPNIVYMLPE